MVQINGCSGVCVSDSGIILTAKHCGTPETADVEFAGTAPVKAKLVSNSKGWDACVAYDCEGDGFPFLNVAGTVPPMGFRVWSYGFPATALGRTFNELHGQLSGVRYMAKRACKDCKESHITEVDSDAPDGVRCNSVTFASIGGHSGGPLLDSRNEVLGVLSTGSHNASNFISHAETLAVYKQVTGKEPAATAYRRQSVIVFVTNDCPPCIRLKQDIAAGKLGSYDFQFVSYNQELGTWTDKAMAEEFAKTASAPAGLGFPVIWVRGTDKYRAGYEPDRRGGIVGWLAGIFDGLGRLIIGDKPAIGFPAMGSAPNAPATVSLPVIDEEVPSQASTTLASVQALKDDLLKAKADLEMLKSANPLTKLKGLVALKSDVSEIKANAEEALKEAKSLKDDAKEKPLQYLWGLFAVISGLIHKRAEA